MEPTAPGSRGTITPVISAHCSMVGRTGEFGTLEQLWSRARTGRAQLALIGAEAGGGKTTLIDTFTATVTDGLVVSGACVPMGEQGLTFAAVSGWLRRLQQVFGTETLARWAGVGWDALAQVMPSVVSPAGVAPSTRIEATAGDSDRRVQFEAIMSIIEKAAAERPLLLVVEDLHWSDESTRDLLRFMTGAVSQASLLVLGSYRTDELHRRHPLRPWLGEMSRLSNVHRLDLPRLTAVEVVQMVRSIRPEPLPDSVLDQILQRSEGIPYFVAELASSPGIADSHLPWSLRDALMGRLSVLDEHTQTLLRLVSAAGNRIDESLLNKVAADWDRAVLERSLRAAIEAQVLMVDEDGYAFRHALLREVAHEELLPGEHARVHALFSLTLLELVDEPTDLPEALDAWGEPTADASCTTAANDKALRSSVRDLRRGQIWSEIAAHALGAHDLDLAFRAALAGARDLALDPPQSQRLFERALDLWDSTPASAKYDRAAVLEEAAEMARLAGNTDRSVALIDQSLELTPEDDKLARVRRMVLKARTVRHKMIGAVARTESMNLLREAVALAEETGDDESRLKAMAGLAGGEMLVGKRDLTVARRTVEEAHRLGFLRTEASALNTYGCLLVGAGFEDEGLAALERSGKIEETTGRTIRYFINRSDALNNANREAGAVEVALAGLDVAREAGMERSLGVMLGGNAAVPLLSLGRWDEARARVARALELRPPEHHLVNLELTSAWIQVWSGDLDGAESILGRYRPVFADGQLGLQAQFATWQLSAEIELLLTTGGLERGRSLVEGLWANSDYFHMAGLQYLSLAAARVAVARGRDPREVAEIETMVAGIPRLRSSGWMRPLIDAELEDSVDTWRIAVAAQDGAPLHLRLHGLLGLAGALAPVGSRDEVAALLDEVVAEATPRGIGLLLSRAQALRQRLGLGERGSAGLLTAREQQVLDLLAEGLSNSAVGERLFISRKTASVHVSNILAKLSVGSRGEAVAEGRRRGMIHI